jgi:hypothetical protein
MHDHEVEREGQMMARNWINRTCKIAMMMMMMMMMMMVLLQWGSSNLGEEELIMAIWMLLQIQFVRPQKEA